MTVPVLDAFCDIFFYLAPFLLVLGVGGFLSDYVLDRCPRVCAWLEKVLDVDLTGGFDDDD